MTEGGFPAYRRRQVAYAGLHRVGDWHVKLYTIDAGRTVRPTDSIDAALTWMVDLLPQDGGDGHGEAFAIVHAGEDAVWLLVHWWTDTCLLHHRVVAATLEAPDRFDVAVPDTLVACSWELAVVQHERDAWVRHVQGAGTEADRDAYRADVVTSASV